MTQRRRDWGRTNDERRGAMTYSSKVPLLRCDPEVTRNFILEPCDKPAVRWLQPHPGVVPWPACPWHLNRDPSWAIPLPGDAERPGVPQ